MPDFVLRAKPRPDEPPSVPRRAQPCMRAMLAGMADPRKGCLSGVVFRAKKCLSQRRIREATQVTISTSELDWGWLNCHPLEEM